MIVGTHESPDVVAIVPTLGTKPERLLRALDSLWRQETDARLAVVVVINSDNVDAAAGLPDWARVEVAGLNLGWAGGLAFGRSLVEADHVWLVQDDMVLAPGCLDGLLVALADDSGLGMVAPLVLDDDGLVVARTGGAYRTPDGVYVDWQPPEATPIHEFTTMDGYAYIGSRGMLVRTSVWDDVGGMDPLFYPLTWADADFCAALDDRGYRFRLVAEAHCTHEQSGSTPSRYSGLLWHRHLERLERKWLRGVDEGAEARSAPVVHPELKPHLLTSIAVAAASLASALAVRFEESDSKLAETWERLGQTNDYAVATERERDEARRLIDELRHERDVERGALDEARRERDEAHRDLAQSRSEAERLRRELGEVHEHIETLERDAQAVRQELDAVLHSRSWRLSAPLRRASSFVRRRRGH